MLDAIWPVHDNHREEYVCILSQLHTKLYVHLCSSALKVCGETIRLREKMDKPIIYVCDRGLYHK